MESIYPEQEWDEDDDDYTDEAENYWLDPAFSSWDDYMNYRFC